MLGNAAAWPADAAPLLHARPLIAPFDQAGLAFGIAPPLWVALAAAVQSGGDFGAQWRRR
jgi:hypothetical protein